MHNASVCGGKLEEQRQLNRLLTPCHGHANCSLSCPQARKARQLVSSLKPGQLGHLLLLNAAWKGCPALLLSAGSAPFLRGHGKAEHALCLRGDSTCLLRIARVWASLRQSPDPASPSPAAAAVPQPSLLEPRGCSPGHRHRGLPPAAPQRFHAAEHKRWHESVIAEVIFR